LKNLKLRLKILQKNLDMASHNLFCYSNTALLNSPKEKYAEEWLQSKLEIEELEKWINEINNDIIDKAYE